MEKQVRIAVFTGDLCYSVRQGIAEIERVIPGVSLLIMVHSPCKSTKKLIKNQLLNFRQNGWRWLPYQANDIITRLIPNKIDNEHPQTLGYKYSMASLLSRPNVVVEYPKDINGEQAVVMLKAYKADIGLSLASPILKAPLFHIPRLGTLNLHKGRVPDYRGMPPAFWELWNNEKSVGCTIHRVDEKLDTGPVLATSTVERLPFSDLRSMQLALDEIGVKLMRDAVVSNLAGEIQLQPQTGTGRTFKKPTLAQRAELNRKLKTTTNHSNRARDIIKNSLFSLAMLHGKVGLRRYLQPRITVLLYHRVTDEVRDNLTVGVAQFDRQMALIRKHCEVLSIDRVLDSQQIPTSSKPLVAVSFDDGYLDNYTNAAPILIRHGIPASFFVTTGIINSDQTFSHDVRRGNPVIPVMNWDQVRTMRDHGFTIGSHTVNHIDCVSETQETVVQELAQSYDTLQQELGIKDQIFAYPYGGRHNMNDERLELVKQQGYIGCLSAYGGNNLGTVDRYKVLRKGIHWEYSDHAFLFECLGLR